MNDILVADERAITPVLWYHADFDRFSLVSTARDSAKVQL